MGTVSIADLDQLDSIASQIEALQPTIEQLAQGGITGTADCRWGRIAANAFGTFNSAAQASTKQLAGLLPDQAVTIRQYTKRERELQQKTKKESDQLGETIPQMPKVQPTTSGGPNADGTWTI